MITTSDVPSQKQIAARTLSELERMRAPHISKAMVSAGLRVLRESGALAGQLSSDDLLVRRILEVALSSRNR